MTELPIVLDRFPLKFGGGSLSGWLEQWKGRDDVRLLVATDGSEVVVVNANAALEPARDGLWAGVPRA